jgi:hypothetical protein
MANTSLTTIVDSYGCMSNYQEMKAFFANPTNARGVQDAINKYGLPVANRPSYNTGFGIFKKNWGWVDFCDWQNISKFYQYARLSVQFPILTNPQTDCTKVASAILALNSQLANVANVTKDANIKTALTEALNDKIAEYQSFNVVNDCENLVKNQSYISTTGATAKTAIYIFGGAAVVIGLFYAIAVYKKNN